MGEQTAMAIGGPTLDEMIDKLDEALKELAEASEEASRATSRKNAARKEVAKFAEAVVQAHRQPSLPLEQRERATERIRRAASAVAASDSDEDDDDGDKATPAAREPEPWTGPRSVPTPADGADVVSQLVDAVSNVSDPIPSADNEKECVCGFALESPNEEFDHPAEHAAFLQRIRDGDMEAREHAAACLAAAGVNPYAETPAPEGAKPEPKRAGGGRKGGAKKKASPAPRGRKKR